MSNLMIKDRYKDGGLFVQSNAIQFSHQLRDGMEAKVEGVVVVEGDSKWKQRGSVDGWSR